MDVIFYIKIVANLLQSMTTRVCVCVHACMGVYTDSVSSMGNFDQSQVTVQSSVVYAKQELRKSDFSWPYFPLKPTVQVNIKVYESPLVVVFFSFFFSV